MSRHSVNSGTPKKAIKPPAYCLHKPSGQAVVYLDRRAVYLGPHDSAESWELYWQTVADYADPATRRVASFVTEDGSFFDRATGQQFDGAREYDSATQRWDQSDPLGLAAC